MIEHHRGTVTGIEWPLDIVLARDVCFSQKHALWLAAGEPVRIVEAGRAFGRTLKDSGWFRVAWSADGAEDTRYVKTVCYDDIDWQKSLDRLRRRDLDRWTDEDLRVELAERTSKARRRPA